MRARDLTGRGILLGLSHSLGPGPRLEIPHPLLAFRSPGPMAAYLDAFRRVPHLPSRLARRSFWMFFAVHTLVSAGFLGADLLLDLMVHGTVPSLFLAYQAASALSLLGSGMRRLHDVSYSGVWAVAYVVARLTARPLIALLPRFSVLLPALTIALGFWSLSFGVCVFLWAGRSVSEPNRFGPYVPHALFHWAPPSA